MRICPGCGKHLSKGTFCNECRPMPDLKLKDLKLDICTECKKIFIANRWKSFNSLDEGIRFFMEKQLKNKLKEYTLSFDSSHILINPGYEDVLEVEVGIGESYFIVPITIMVRHCKVCSKKGTHYFEGTLQVRNPTPEIWKFIADFFKSKNIFLNDEKKMKNGFDIKVTSQKHVQTIGRRLKKEFGGILKISPHIYSQDPITSKQVYRVNVLFEAFPFTIGDAIMKDGVPIKATSLGKINRGIDLRTGKKVTFELKDKKYEILKKMETTVTKDFPVIEVMHPETFQNVEAQPYIKAKIGESVTVALTVDSLFVL